METKIDNIITYANVLTMTKKIVAGVGFELQAPLSDAEIDEIVAGRVMHAVHELTGKASK